MHELMRLDPDPPLWVDPIYRRLGYREALPEVWLRGAVIARLRDGAEAASERGHGLLVWDGWRPGELQRALHVEYRAELARTTGLEGGRLDELVARFVTDPDRRVPPPAHGTGGAVDLTLCDPETGEPRDMGGAFDELTIRSEPLYYDDHPDPDGYAELRRTLDSALAGAGFVGLPTEWWHFEYGTALWAQARGETVLFDPTDGPSPESVDR
jgi:zinc D-Ala-D-Ala dipeptidase